MFVESMIASHPGAELWWDSLPSALGPWQASIAGRRPGGLITGATSNPRLVREALEREPERWAPVVRALAAAHGAEPPAALYGRLMREVFAHEAALFRPLWERSGGTQGWVCAQLSPEASFDVAAMVREGRALAAVAPNVMVKVPGSAEGYAAIEALTAAGVATNATLSFTLAQFEAHAGAVRRGLAARTDDRPWRSVFTFMAGRLGAALAGLEGEAVRWAEVAVAKRLHQAVEESGLPVKLLLCSLQLDDGPRCRHLEETRGAAVVYTVPPALLAALLALPESPGGGMAAPLPPGLLDRLMADAAFREAHEPQGLAPSAFARQPAFVRGLADVTLAYQQSLAWIASTLDARRSDPPCPRP